MTTNAPETGGPVFMRPDASSLEAFKRSYYELMRGLGLDPVDRDDLSEEEWQRRWEEWRADNAQDDDEVWAEDEEADDEDDDDDESLMCEPPQHFWVWGNYVDYKMRRTPPPDTRCVCGQLTWGEARENSQQA